MKKQCIELRNMVSNFNYVLFMLSFLFVMFFFSASSVYATGEIRGFVYEEETGRPVPYATVVLEDLTRGTETNREGAYHLKDVPEGRHLLRVSYLGYDTVQVRLEVNSGEVTTHNFFITEMGIDLDEFDVVDRRARQEEIRVGGVELEPAEVQRLPAVGGEPDLAQYLQVLPGVVHSGDQGGQLYIRGGAPVQNKVLMDGMTVYNPFHSIGLFSVFDIDAVENIDVITGGFPAEYGGRTSSVIDISMREGNRVNHKGKFSLTPFMAKGLAEGPIKPREPDENTAVSYLLSARGSYLEQTSPVFYAYADTADVLPFNFMDVFGKVTVDSRAGSKLSVYGFNFADRVNYPGATNFKWDSYGLGTDFFIVPSDHSTIIEGHIAFSDYQVEQQERDELPRYSQVNGFDAGMDFTYYIGHDRVEYGIDIRGFKTDYEFFNAAGRRINQTQHSTETGGYLQFHKLWRDWVFDPGVRLHYYASLNELQVEPRMALQYNFTDWLRANASGGFYSQNLISTTSDRDVVNLFSGFLSAPEQLTSEFAGETVTSRLQKSRHLLAGIEMDLFTHSTFTVEGYYKDFNQLINMNRNKVFDRTFTHHPLHLRSDFIREEGEAYGLDFMLKYDQRPWYIWTAYSLAKVTRFDGREEYSPHWDRRHNVDILAGYRFGEKDAWEVNARWNFGTGFPFTKTQGFYERITFDDGASTDYGDESGELTPIYSDLNTGRLPDYHRLDISAKRTFFLKNDQELEITAGATNVYNRSNVFYFDRVSHARVDQLPIIPTLGISYSY